MAGQTETIEWLEAHPDASPGGHDDLFDMPLPDGFQEANQLFIEGEEWGWDGSAKTGGWEIGKSGWIVEPSIAEIWSVFE